MNGAWTHTYDGAILLGDDLQCLLKVHAATVVAASNQIQSFSSRHSADNRGNALRKGDQGVAITYGVVERTARADGHA